MPALQLFGRRWLVAGDDVPLPAAFLALFHFIWTILLAIWLAEIDARKDCEHIESYRVAVSGLISTFALSFLLEIVACVIGFRGAPFETKKRSVLPVIIYVNGVSILAQIGFNGYATSLVTSDPPKCSDPDSVVLNPEDVMKGLVWSTWAVIAFILMALIGAYNLFPNYKDPQQWEDQCNCLSLACCNWLVCFDFGRTSRVKSGTASRRLGGLFSLIFSHIDFTPTDVILAAGLALARQRNKVRRKMKDVARDNEHGSAFIKKSNEACSQDSRGEKDVGWKPQSVSDHNIEIKSSAKRLDLGSDALQCHPLDNQSISPTSSDLLLDNTVENGHETTSGVNSKPVLQDFSLRQSSQNISQPDLEQGIGNSEASNERVTPEILDETAHFMKFAFAAYGWMLFVWQRKTAGIFQLCTGRLSGIFTSVASNRRMPFKGLKMQFLNSEAIIKASEIEEKDLIFARFEGQKQNVLPYFIALDHLRKSVVISIRGSLSLDDVVRDLLFEPADLDEWISGHKKSNEIDWTIPPPEVRPASRSTRFAAHSGILEAAWAVLNDIQNVGKLHSLLSGNYTEYPEARGYRITVCGHSLGAGCAFLISLYLKQFYPTLRCYAFSPPGGLATNELCKSVGNWCISVVCGKEMVPRLTLSTFERLRDELVYCSTFCRKHKLHLFIGWILGWRWPDKDLFYQPDDLPEEPQWWIENYHKSIAETSSRRSFVDAANFFCPPGRIIHLRPIGIRSRSDRRYSRTYTSSSSASSENSEWNSRKRKTVYREYEAVYIDGQTLVDEGVIMSGRMMADHMPDFMLALLRRFAVISAEEGISSSVILGDRAGEREINRGVDWKMAEEHWQHEKEHNMEPAHERRA